MYSRDTKEGGKGGLPLFLTMLGGVVLGGYLGELLKLLGEKVSWLSFLHWANFGFDFGFVEPFCLDAMVFTVTIGLTVRFTLCGLLGLGLAALLYWRIRN